MAAWAVERGFYLSFTGNITYGNKKIKKAIERTPIERIMVETDAPYMVPEPLRSEGIKKCEPWMCAEVVKKIALIKNLDLESVGEQIYNNSKSFFGL
jgi:TatD DNase family protein